MEEYSLWLMPDSESSEYERLSGLIAEYAEKYEDAPVFEPHVTVVGGVTSEFDEAQTVSDEIAQKRSPPEVVLFRPHCSTTRFQCVYLLVEPSRELLGLHQEAADTFNYESGMYVPHLSLIYSDIPVRERRQLVEEFDVDMLPLTFTAETLRLVETSGGVEEWNVIGDYSFS